MFRFINKKIDTLIVVFCLILPVHDLWLILTAFDGIIQASSRENLSSGFLTKQDSNQSPQLQRLARKLKFRL